MSYEIEALAAKEYLLRKHQSAFHNAHVVRLAQGFALIPMTGAFYEEVNRQTPEGDKAGLHGFELLSPAVAAWIEQISRDGAIAYFEAGYFGGMGSQRAIVWQNGVIARGPLYGDAIDQALRMLGVERSGECDEFDTVGLGKYRETEKWAACVVVDDFQRHSDGAITGLVEALHFEHSSKVLRELVREFAAGRLGTMGTAAKEAIPVLVQTARTDDDYGVRLSATCALAAIGPEAVSSLTDLLTAADVQDRWPAAFALSKLGPSARDAVPALVCVLSDPDYRVRSQAAKTLGGVGPEARRAVAVLSEALNDPEWPVRFDAAEALGKIGPDAKQAASGLRKALSDDNEFVRQAADEALRNILESGEPPCGR